MDWSIIEPLKFQFCVTVSLFAVIAFERFRVGAHKTGPHRCPAFSGFDQHEPPRLAVTNGWSVAGKFKKRVNQNRIDGIAAKPADIAAPEHEVTERLPKGGIELSRGWIGRLGHIAIRSMTWKNVPVVEPCRAPCSGTSAPAASQQSTSGSPFAKTVLA